MLGLVLHFQAVREFMEQLPLALAELAGIARQNGDHVSARRLTVIMHELNSSGDIQRQFAQTA